MELIITCSKNSIQLDTWDLFLTIYYWFIKTDYREQGIIQISNIALTIFICVGGIRAKFVGQESRFTQITSKKNEFFKEGHHLYDILLVSFKNYSPLFLLSVMQQLLEVGIPIMSKLQDVFPLLEYTGNYIITDMYCIFFILKLCASYMVLTVYLLTFIL